MSMFMLRGISIFAQEHKGLEKSKKLDPSTVYRRDIYSLKGLKGISIAVEDLPNVAIKDGLSEQQLEADAELKLRQAGIKVIPLDLNSKIPGSPILHININQKKFDEPE